MHLIFITFVLFMHRHIVGKQRILSKTLPEYTFCFSSHVPNASSAYSSYPNILGIYLNRNCPSLVVISGGETYFIVQTWGYK